MRVPGVAVRERVDGAGHVCGIDADRVRLKRLAQFGVIERRHVNHFEPRRRLAQQPQRAAHVPAREHEPVAARDDGAEQIPHDVAQAREVLERAELEHLVDQERGRPAVCRARPREECDSRLEGGQRRRGRQRHVAGHERRVQAERPVEALGRARRALEIHVLAVLRPEARLQIAEERTAPAAAAAQKHGDARRRGVDDGLDASQQRGARDRHGPTSRAGLRIGSVTPCRSAVASASG